jgi:glutathione S-transferase
MPGAVRTPSITSTTFMSGTGLKKCRPATRSGCAHAAAIAVTESDEVLLARMQPGATTPSSARKISRFASRSSTIASITTPQPAKSATLATGTSRAIAPAASLDGHFPFSTRRWSCAAMDSFAACAVPARVS